MKVGVIGMGLMGGSFGRLLVKKGIETFGADISRDAMIKGEMLSAFNAPLDFKNAGEIDLLIVAVVPSRFRSAVEPYLPYLKDGATVTDFCGIKRGVVSDMKEMSRKFPALNFIGGHPMAGREFSGIERSSVNLFEKASMILVPVKADVFTLDSAKKFYLSLGFGKVVITDAENHDAIIAYTSQLCHIVSNAFIKNKTAEKRAGFSAGSFKDLTRVARMNPDMWTELILENGDNALIELDEIISNLSLYRKAIAEKDADALRRLFKDGNDRKIKIESEKNSDD